jgi:WD40 repeat protein
VESIYRNILLIVKANELIYAFDNTICYYNINSKNKISELEMNEDKNFTITEMSWYNLDENYKYVLVGMNDGQSFLVDVSQSFIIMKFEKYSNSKKYL